MRTKSNRRTPALVWLLVLGFTGYSGLARGAEPTAPSALEIGKQRWLEWAAPPECPTSRVIEDQVRGWVDGDVPPSDELRVRASVTANADGWNVHIIVHDGDVQGERRVATATCADAAQLVAIAAALAMAPDGSSIPDEARHPPGTVRDEEAAPDARAQAVAAPEPSAEERTDETHRKIPWSIGLGALLGTGLLPGVRGGLALGGDIRLGHVGASLRGLWFPAMGFQPASGAAHVDLGAIGGSASVAYYWGGPRVAAGPSLGAEAGALIADQQGEGAARSPTPVPWLALLVGGRVRLPLYKSVRAVVGADLLLPLVRPDLILDDGTPVHRVDIGARGLLEISFESSHDE